MERGVFGGTCLNVGYIHIPPLRERVEDIPLLTRYFIEGGRAEGVAYALLPMHRQKMSVARQQIIVLSAFVEVYLAREGHGGAIGANLLTKVQLPNLASLYGAMLADVDVILMGAGIPKEIPGVLDALAEHRPCSLKLEVDQLDAGRTEEIHFDPALIWEGTPPAPLRRPRFFAIVASNSLATMLKRKASGRVDGFIVEGPTAGGHNAPPRGGVVLNDAGEPIYGDRDVVDLAALGELGLPFWLAGSAGSPGALERALGAGAAGVQVGTLFAYARESGLAAEYKQSVLDHALRGEVKVHTDPRASPTGYPFKVVKWAGDPTGGREEPRVRLCDLGYLRTAYKREDGRIDYRCPAEPTKDWIRKGGAPEATEGRKCLCNGLMANIDLPQHRAEGDERAVLTTGNELANMKPFLGERESYSAGDVIDYLTSLVGDRRAAPAYASEPRLSPRAAEIAAS